MPLSIKPVSALVDTAKTYVRSQEAYQGLDQTTRRRSLLGGLVKGFALAIADWYRKLKDYADNDPFPQTARGDFLTRRGWWLPLTGLSIQAASQARGIVVAPATAGSIIPRNAELISGGRSYRTRAAATALTNTIAADSLTHDGGLAILETAAPHGLASGLAVTISGASPAAYNGRFEITVTAANELTYELGADPGANASGSIIASTVLATLDVSSELTGQTTNVDAGNRLQIVDPPAGFGGTAIVTWGGVAGGTDDEDPEAFRERVLDALGATLGMFTDSEVESIVRTVPGVTRVWIRKAREAPALGWPAEGQVRIAFMRDDDANPFPSAQEVADVKAALVDTEATKIMPCHMVEANLMVFSPTPRVYDFVFTQLVPDTPGLRLAIGANLRQFFAEEVAFGSDRPKEPDKTVYAKEYERAIERSVDPDTGQRLRTFTLSSPTGDLEPDPDDLPILGQVIFSS